MLIALGCRSTPTGHLAADVARYLDAMQAWAAAEVEADRAVERVLATHFVDEAEVFRQMADSRPRISRHLHALEAYRPATADVLAVHEAYKGAWTTLLTGYADIEAGLADGDATRLAEGRALLHGWRRRLRVVANDLRDLSDVAGVPRAPRARGS